MKCIEYICINEFANSLYNTVIIFGTLRLNSTVETK